MKNDSVASEVQRRFLSTRQMTQTQGQLAIDTLKKETGHTDLNTHRGFNEEKDCDAKVAKILADCSGVPTTHSATATTAQKTPFKDRQTVLQVKTAHNMHTETAELLQSIQLTPGFNETASISKINLMACTPVHTAGSSSTGMERERTQMLAMTPGDALLLGKPTETDIAFKVVMPPVTEAEEEEKRMHTPPPGKAAQNARKVLFAESPPTPPLLTLSPPGQVAAMGFTSSLFDNAAKTAPEEVIVQKQMEARAEECSSPPGCTSSPRSPRAHLLKSASKQLSNVMDSSSCYFNRCLTCRCQC